MCDLRTSRRSARRGAALGLLAAIGLAACGPILNTLEGSIGEQSTLDFDQVRVEWVMEQLVIRYLSTRFETSEAVRITVDRELVGVDVDIPLEDDRVLVEHYYTLRDENRQFAQEPPFPEVESGTLRIDQAGSALGEPVSGEFSCLFVNGRTLSGTFAVALSAPSS